MNREQIIWTESITAQWANFMFKMQFLGPKLFAVTWFNNAYSAIVKVKLFVCIGEMISFRYGTRIPANLTQ